MTDDERYKNACHAMQSGVAMMMNYDSTETEPKHLRVGVNAAMVEFSALVRLLIDKGVMTLEEFEKYLADDMEEEARRYERRIKNESGVSIKLR